MRKIGFLLFLSNLFIGASLHAQILNGSFSSGLTDWNVVGSVSTDDQGALSGTYADVSSTNGSGGVDVVPTIDTDLDVVLPNTNIENAPTQGEAIYQQFAVGQASTLSFDFSYSTFDTFPYDSAGYVLDGVYHQLEQTPANQQTTPSAFQAVGNIALSAGEHQLAFVSYNTHDNSASTHIYITDIEVDPVPEPSTFILTGIGLVVLGLSANPARRRALARVRA